MILTKKDLAILDKFKFDVQPVGVKFLTKRPDSIERLDENMALCEMLKKAQEGNAFFADKENHMCDAGPYVLGQADVPGAFYQWRIWSRAENLRRRAFRKQALPLYTEDRERCR